jgi:hypothetical protein
VEGPSGKLQPTYIPAVKEMEVLPAVAYQALDKGAGGYVYDFGGGWACVYAEYSIRVSLYYRGSWRVWSSDVDGLFGFSFAHADLEFNYAAPAR